MDKAITILQDLLGYEEEAKAKTEIHEAIAELQAHREKIDELKEWATTTYNYFDKIIDNAPATVKTDFEEGVKIICKDILQKLEELEVQTA